MARLAAVASADRSPRRGPAAEDGDHRPQSDGVERAGFGRDLDAGDRLFDAILASPSGVVFTDDELEETWRRISTPDGRVHVAIPQLLDDLDALGEPPVDDPIFPFLLSAGERRSFTANTILRDPRWRKRDTEGALRIAPIDAERLGLADGDTATLTTHRATTTVAISIDDGMQAGHLALPNGLGLDHLDGENRTTTGIAPNELTASAHRDPWAGTPWHKTVPARLAAVRASLPIIRTFVTTRRIEQPCN